MAHMSRFDAAAVYEEQVKEEYAKLSEEYQAKRRAKLERDEAYRAVTAQQSQERQYHPDAQFDWGGTMIPPNSRKHSQNHVSQKEGMTREHGWFMPSEQAEMERKANRRKAFENDQRFVGVEGDSQNLPLHTAAYQAAPGVFTHDTSHWRTEKQSQAAGEQLGYGRKKMKGVKRVQPFDQRHLRGRRPGVDHDYGPLEEQQGVNRGGIGASMANEKHYQTQGSMSDILAHTATDDNMGFAGGKGYRGGSNMLANIGASIASKFIRNGSLPKTGPADRTLTNSTLVLDNHAKVSMPGYTGKMSRMR